MSFPKHSQVVEAEPKWQRISDCLGGSDAVKFNAKCYVPVLSGQLPEDYANYVNRGLFYGATRMTHAAFLGAIFRKELSANVPQKYQPRLENINGAGESLHSFAKCVTSEVLALGRYMVLVDLPDSHDFGDPLNGLPYLTGYTASNIVNWRYRIVGGRRVLDQVIVTECRDVPSPSGWGSMPQPAWRVLELDETGHYRIRVFATLIAGDEPVEIERYEPESGRGRLTQIPAVFIGPGSLGADIQHPPLLELADVNLSHFRSSCDLEAGRHTLAWPIPVLIGIQQNDAAVFRVGAEEVWTLPMGGDAKMLEFQGSGLQYLQDALTEKQILMSALGARLLDTPKRTAETAEALLIRQSGETASLAAIARTVSDGLTAALRIAMDWAGLNGEATVELNQDLADQRLSPQDLTALIAAVQAGLMTPGDFVWNLEKGEMLQPGRTIAEVVDQLEQQQLHAFGTPARQPVDQQVAP